MKYIQPIGLLAAAGILYSTTVSLFVLVSMFSGSAAVAMGEANSLVVEDQPLSDVVSIRAVQIRNAQGGYVVVQKYDTWFTNFILGVSEYLPPGRYENISIPLRSYMPTPEIPALVSGERLKVFLYEESEKEPPEGVDELYGALPLRDIFGNIIVREFFLL